MSWRTYCINVMWLSRYGNMKHGSLKTWEHETWIHEDMKYGSLKIWEHETWILEDMGTWNMDPWRYGNMKHGSMKMNFKHFFILSMFVYVCCLLVCYLSEGFEACLECWRLKATELVHLQFGVLVLCLEYCPRVVNWHQKKIGSWNSSTRKFDCLFAVVCV